MIIINNIMAAELMKLGGMLRPISRSILPYCKMIYEKGEFYSVTGLQNEVKLLCPQETWLPDLLWQVELKGDIK